VAHRAGELLLRREDDGQVLCENCVLADTFVRRLRGLLGRRELPAGEGIVLRPEWSVHTFFMRMTIDIAFVTRDGRVVRSVPNVRPWRITGAFGAFATIEMAAGTLLRTATTAGHSLLLRAE